MTLFSCRHAVMALIFALFPCFAAQASDVSPVGEMRCMVDPTWPQKTESLRWGPVSGITVDDRDQVYLFHRKNPTVQVFGADGTLVRSWSTDNPKGTHYIKLDPDGNVWITDFRSHLVEKYTPEGKRLLRLGVAGEPGCDERHFNGPTDMAFLPGGDVFISDGYGNRRIVHFNKQGRFVKAWGEEGTGPGQFALPHAIAIDAQKRLYVADRNNGRIQVFDTRGKLLAVWDDLLVPWGFAVTKNDEIWVCGSSKVRQPGGKGWTIAPPPDQWLMKLDTNGKALLRVPLPMPKAGPSKTGEVDWVHSIGIDSKGRLYLGDIEGKRAQRFLLQKSQ